MKIRNIIEYCDMGSKHSKLSIAFLKIFRKVSTISSPMFHQEI